MSGRGSTAARVSASSLSTIPSDVKMTIQRIKEIIGNHSEDEIYAILKECSMDPNDAAQKLLLLDMGFPKLECASKMDHTETKLDDSLTSPKESSELRFYSPVLPEWEPGPSDHNHHLPDQTVEEEKGKFLHKELKEHLHLREEPKEEEEESISNGWNKGELGFKSGWSDWGEEFKDVDNGKEVAWSEEGVFVVEVKEEENYKHERSNVGEGEEGFKTGWSDWGEEFKDAENGNEVAWSKEGVCMEEVEEEGNQEHEKSNGGFVGGGVEAGRYPVRPGAEDCSFYVKTGTCKFGFNCKFNHPVRRKNQAAKQRAKEREETAEKPGLAECKYYLRTGGCKYGNACRFNHSRAKTPPLPEKTPTLPAKTPAFSISELNFLGLPIRPGEKECPYYMRNGSCKYGANCRFNHPDPTAAGGSDPPAFSNGGSPSLQSSSKSNVSSWSSPRALNDTAPLAPMMFSQPQGIPSQNPEWNGYQVPPVFSPEMGVHNPPAYAISNPATESNAYWHQQQPKPVDEFPERPGQPECSYFMKTGVCKFKSNCKYHHPKNRTSKPPPCALSDMGLPLRPDQNICSHYSRYGICKFGPACKFNHPIQPASASSFDDQPSHNQLLD